MRIRSVLTGGLMLGTAACSNFLDAPEATTNPNQPTVANADQLVVVSALASP